MAYKIPNIPSSKDYIEELADFWEIRALQSDEIVSQINIGKTLAMESDELLIDGVESEEDETDETLDDVLIEINNRKKLINEYPFEINTYSIKKLETSNQKSLIYIFLLLATRYNMRDFKILDGVDATLEFEHLCAIVAKNYFGHTAKSFVFGTGMEGGFKQKVEHLIKELRIDAQFNNPNPNPPTKKDDGVDVVVWKNFTDNLEGKLIAFGQCKTGTNWRDSIQQLNPSRFCTTWLTQSPVFTPIPMIFLADTMIRNFNFISDQRGKLFFNRFRIIENLPSTLPEDLLSKIKKWTQEAISLL